MDDARIAPAPRPELVSEAQRRFFGVNGYLVLERFFSPECIARLKTRIDSFWTERKPECPLTVDCFEDYPNGSGIRRRLFREVSAHSRAWPYKLNDTHLVDEVITEFAVDRRLMGMLTELLGGVPVVCNTLVFERSSQQPAHFDTFFMPSKTPNKMCATWIAMDPVTDDNGPLFYYPGSHRIEPYRFSDGTVKANDREYPLAEAHIAKIIETHDLKKEVFYAQPGDVFIWHAQLLHGGSVIRDMAQTRTSLVTHYWTTIDYPSAEQHIVLGEGRLLLRKGHQQVLADAEQAAIVKFAAGLETPPDLVEAAPPEFDPNGYLLKNPDVFRAGENPYVHYLNHGRREGRSW